MLGRISGNHRIKRSWGDFFRVEEKRKFKRIVFKEAVEFTMPSGHLPEGSIAYDLSQGGVRLYLSDFITPSTEMVLSIHLSEERRVNVSGRVVWVQKVPHAEAYHAGLAFMETDTNPLSIEELRQFVETHHSA